MRFPAVHSPDVQSPCSAQSLSAHPPLSGSCSRSPLRSLRVLLGMGLAMSLALFASSSALAQRAIAGTDDEEEDDDEDVGEEDDEDDLPSSRRGAVPPPPSAPEPAKKPAPADDDDGDDDILAPAKPDEPTAAPVARAKVGMVMLVPVGKADKPLAEQVSKSLLAELAEARFEVVPIELAAGGASGSVDLSLGQAALKEAKKNLDRGQGLLADLRFDRAEKSFQEASQGLQKAAAALTDLAPVIETHLGFAELYARQGMEDETREALIAAICVNPEHELDPAKYPPLFIRTHAEVRAEVLGGPKGAVVVDSTGRGATVQIDGKELGKAPLRVKDLPVGTHYVRVFQDGVGLYGTIVEVSEGKEASVAPGFFEAGGATPLDLLAQNRFDDEAAKKVAASAKAQSLAGIIVGVVSKGRADVPTALIYVDAASAMVRHTDVMTFDGDLLNMAIEALKGREEIEQAMAGKTFSKVDDEPLIEGVKGAAELDVPTVAMRYDVDAAASGGGRGASGRGSSGRAGRVGGGEPEEGGDDEDGRKLASAGSSGSRKSIRSGIDAEDPLKRRERREELVEDTESSILLSPWLWTGVAAGALTVVAVAGAAGGVGVYLVAVPPSKAQVQVHLPE